MHYLFLIFIFSLLSSLPAVLPMQRNLRQFRANLQLPKEIDLARRTLFLEQFCSFLPSYSSDQWTSLLQAFLQEELAPKAFEYTIVDSSSTYLKGKSFDKVFFIYDHKDQLQYVIKAFNNPNSLSGKFLSEICALDVLQNLQIPHFRPIQPIAAALGVINGKEYGILLETAAKGVRLDQYIYAIAKCPIDSSAREAELKCAGKAFWRMGKSLAFLHGNKSSKVNFLPAEIIAKMDAKLEEISSNQLIMSLIEESISSDLFWAYLQEVKNQTKEIYVYLTYQHGDAHLGNMFYNEWDDMFSLIDSALLIKSIDINGNPLLDGTGDFFRADEHFRRKAYALLSNDEIDQLLASYHAGYYQVEKNEPNPNLEIFYRTYLKLSRLLSYCNFEKETNTRKRSKDRTIFFSTLNDLGKMVLGSF